jgi:hypothetical protein
MVIGNVQFMHFPCIASDNPIGYNYKFCRNFLHKFGTFMGHLSLEGIMPDITMCLNKGCKKAKKCYRFMAEPEPNYQSYSHFDYKGSCKYFMPILPCRLAKQHISSK